MRKIISSTVCFLLITLVMSCQEKQKEEIVAAKSNRGAGRRACSNSISYKFVYPTEGYGFNGNGCVTYYVQRGVTRQVKVRMSNTGATDDLEILVRFPNQPQFFLYSVASITGGTTSYELIGPNNGAAIRWTANQMPGGTTYEMTLNIGGGSDPSSAENGVGLYVVKPCADPFISDCDNDENLNLVLIN